MVRHKKPLFDSKQERESAQQLGTIRLKGDPGRRVRPACPGRMGRCLNEKAGISAYLWR